MSRLLSSSDTLSNNRFSTKSNSLHLTKQQNCCFQLATLKIAALKLSKY